MMTILDKFARMIILFGFGDDSFSTQLIDAKILNDTRCFNVKFILFMIMINNQVKENWCLSVLKSDK